MDDPVDFSPLDPRSDPARFDRMVSDIVQAAMAPATAASRAGGLVVELLRWARPALAAAAVVALVAGATLLSLRSPAPGEALLEAVGIPAPLAHWARTGHHPSTAELLAAFPQAGDQAVPPAPQAEAR